MSLELDPEDAFEAVLIDMAETARRKGRDYAQDGNRWSNFIESGSQTGLAPSQVAEVLIAVKQARLKALRENGRTPENESVEDTMIDRAVYSVIAIVLARTVDG